MINVTRLLCGAATEGDGLRYGEKVSLAGAVRPQESIHRRPIVVWSSTRCCNLHCAHCYTDSHDVEYPGELSTEEATTFIDDLADYGVPVLLFSGGEPLYRQDLLPLISYGVQKGLRCVLSTNGTLITPSVAGELKSVGVSYVGVSIDGIEEKHDKFRGAKGAFKAAVQGLHNCMEAGIKGGLRFTLTSYNAMDLGAIFDLVETEDIPRICVYHLAYAGRGARIASADLSHSDSRAALDLIFDRSLDFHRRGLNKDVLTVDNHADAAYLYMRVQREQPWRAEEVYNLLLKNGGNSSGIGIASVDNLGFVHPDQFWMYYSLGNVRERPFSEIWEDRSDPLLAGLKERKGLLKGRCGVCRFLPICNGNLRVRAEAYHGDLWMPDPACYLTDEEIGIGDGSIESAAIATEEAED